MPPKAVAGDPAPYGSHKYKCPLHSQSWPTRDGLVFHLRDEHRLALQRGILAENWFVIPLTIPDWNTVPFPGPESGPQSGMPCTPFPLPGPPPLFRGQQVPSVQQPGLTEWTRNPPADSWTRSIDNRPISFGQEQGEIDRRNQLIPYLAYGFRPQSTPSGDLMCALYALAISLQAVQELITPADDHFYTGEDLIDIFNSEDYETMANTVVDEELDLIVEQQLNSNPALVEDEVRAAAAQLRESTIDGYLQENYLDVNQIK